MNDTLPQDFSYGIIPIRKRNNKRQYLLIQHLAGHWSFPKGHKEFGETDTQTAIREFQEETGLTEVNIISDTVFTEMYERPKGGVKFMKLVTYYIGETDSDNLQIQAKEIQAFSWCSYEEARQKISFDRTKLTLDAAEKFLNSQ